MSGSYTPGPWGSVLVEPFGGFVICHALDGTERALTWFENPADAQLAAAAPELLLAVQKMLSHPAVLLCDCGEPDCATTQACAAVAKACGIHVTADTLADWPDAPAPNAAVSTPPRVAQPNYAALGLGSVEEAEGRN